MKRPIDETMAEARQYFLERARAANGTDERILNEHLREMAEAIQENSRMLDVMRREIGDLHHVLGVR